MENRPDRRQFATTHWSLILAAQPDKASQTLAHEALEELCRAYWYPLYAFVRSRGYPSTDAHDLTQSFFARLIETRGFATADPEKGRFRSYLLGAMKHFLAHDWERKTAKKRGGGVIIIELDALDPEARYSLEPAESLDPDARFEREWAQEVTARTLGKLRREAEAKGKSIQFEALKGSLIGGGPPHEETAALLGLSDGAVKVAVHRLRNRYRELLRAEIAETVYDPADIDDEMRCLVNALLAK